MSPPQREEEAPLFIFELRRSKVPNVAQLASLSHKYDLPTMFDSFKFEAKIGCAIGQEGYPVLPEYTNSKNLLARACCRRGPPTRLCTVFNFIARQERPAGHSGFEGISGNHNLASLWIWRERSAGAISAGFVPTPSGNWLNSSLLYPTQPLSFYLSLSISGRASLKWRPDHACYMPPN